MDTRSGELMDGEKARQRDPMDLESFEHGETVQVKGGFFEICKIDLRGQRLVLKPIPAPIEEEG